MKVNKEKWGIERTFRDGRWVGIEFANVFCAKWFMLSFLNEED